MSKTIYRLLNVGRQPLRYLDQAQERERMCLCWHVTALGSDVAVAELFEISPDSFELWRNGAMTSVPSHRAALEFIAALPEPPFTDEARERLKKKLDAIDKVRRPLLVARRPLDDALRALDELHEAAVEEAGVEMLDEGCEDCGRLLIAGDLVHMCADGPVFCQSCAPTWQNLLNQYMEKEAGEIAEDPEAFAAGLAAAQAAVDAGNGDEKHVWPL